MSHRTIFLILATLFLHFGHSQIDLSFENWNTNAGYIQPNGWIASNWDFLNVFPDSNSTDGYQAAIIENNSIFFFGRGSALLKGNFKAIIGRIDSITFDISVDSVYFGGYARVGAAFFHNGNIVVNRGYNIDTISNGYFKITLRGTNPNASQTDSVWLSFESKPQTLPNGDLDGFCRFKVDNVQFFYSSLSDDTNRNEINDLTFFPNPTTDKIIQVSTSVKRIRIAEMQGNEVHNQLVSNRIIELSFLPSGVYLIILEGDNHFTQEKLIIK